MDFSSYKADSKLGLPANRTSNVRVSNPGADALAREQAKTGVIALQGIDRLRAEVQTGRVMQANNEYNKEMMDLTNELRQNKEQDALNTVEQFDEREQKIRSRIQKKYGSYLYGEAGRKYNDMLTRDYNTRRQAMINYQISEAEKFNDTTLQNGLMDMMSLATADYTNPENVNGAMNKAAHLVAMRYEHYGEEKIKRMTQVVLGNMAGSLVNTAIGKNDMTGAESILSRYGNLIPPEKLSAFAKAIWEYKKKNDEIVSTERLYQKHGGDIRGAFKDIEAGAGSVEIPQSGSFAEQAMAAARYVEERTGIPAALVYGQWVHESTYQGKAFNSPLARENLNFGGLTQREPNGEENKQPDGGNYYKMYKSVKEYADDYINSFIKYYKFDPKDIKTPQDFARLLRQNGYYEGHGNSEDERIANYAAGIASGMRGYNPSAIKIKDPVSIQKQKNDYLAFYEKEKRIKGIEQDNAIQTAQQMFAAAGPNADPRAIAQAVGGTDILLTNTIADMLTRQKYGANQKDLGPAAMDEVTQMLQYGDAFNSSAELIAFMQKKGFSNKEINKGQELWKQKLNGEGIFAFPQLNKYITAQLQNEGTQKNKEREILLRQYAIDFINAFRAEKKRDPRFDELKDALRKELTEKKLVLEADGQTIVVEPLQLTGKNIVSADMAYDADGNNTGLVKVRYRDADNQGRSNEVYVPFKQFSEDMGIDPGIGGNPWLQAIGDKIKNVFGDRDQDEEIE